MVEIIFEDENGFFNIPAHPITPQKEYWELLRKDVRKRKTEILKDVLKGWSNVYQLLKVYDNHDIDINEIMGRVCCLYFRINKQPINNKISRERKLNKLRFRKN